MNSQVMKALGGQSGIVAALDVGSTKVACFIAKIDDDGDIHVIGVGHQSGKGMRAGAVVDLDQARDAIAAAVSTAERIASERVRRVIVNLSCGRFASETGSVEASIAGHEVGESDLKRVLDPARLINGHADRELIHAIPTAFRIDDIRGIRDPRGMFGDHLAVDFHMVMAEPGPVRTLVTCVKGCHLDVEALVVSPFASGIATAVEDELELGVTVIDMGGGTTTAAVFEHGELIHADGVSVGGNHVTTDIAQGLSTPPAEAERIKRLYGNAMPRDGDTDANIEVAQIGSVAGDPGTQIPKSRLNAILTPRLEETLEMLRDRLRAHAPGSPGTTRFILTGGASQLRGLTDLAEEIFGHPVRLGRPARLPGLAESVTGPGFAACAGLIAYAANYRTDGLPGARRTGDLAAGQNGQRGVISRVGTWLRENF